MSSAVEQPALRIEFDRLVASVDAVQRAAYGLAGEASIEVTLRDETVVCTIYPRRDSVVGEEVAHRLRNAVTDEVLRARIAAETAPVRDLIFALAFSQTGLVADEATPE